MVEPTLTHARPIRGAACPLLWRKVGFAAHHNAGPDTVGWSRSTEGRVVTGKCRMNQVEGLADKVMTRPLAGRPMTTVKASRPMVIAIGLVAGCTSTTASPKVTVTATVTTTPTKTATPTVTATT
jgi:hypothetical protein